MINDNDILLSRSMQLLRQLIIDINETKGALHIPIYMKNRMKEASNLVDDYYSSVLEQSENNKNILNQLHSLRDFK